MSQPVLVDDQDRQAQLTMSFITARRSWLIALLLIISISGIEGEVQDRSCYFPSGRPSPGRPCYPDNKQSVCCTPGFTCLSNGICQPGPIIGNEKPYKYSLYRSSCTDPTFNDPACPQFCIGRDDNREAGAGLQLCNASTGAYCCKREYDCCTNSSITYQLGQVEAITTLPRPSVALPTKSHVTAVHQAAEGKSGEYARDTIVGAGAGFGVAMLIFLGGLCFWIFRRHRLKVRARMRARSRDSDSVNAAKLNIHQDPSASVSALAESSPPIELQSVYPHELNGSGSAPDRRPEQNPLVYELEAPLTLERRIAAGHGGPTG